MKCFTLLVVVMLVFNTVADAQVTQTGEAAQATHIKAEVERRAPGEKSRVRVRLRNKVEVKGYISKIEDASFDVTAKGTGQATKIPYGDCISLATVFISLLATHCVSFAANSQTWIEVRSPHFIVVSNASEHDAHRVAEQFEMIRAVFLDYFGRTGTSDPPITILAAKDEGTLRTLLPQFWEKKNSMHPVGIFLDGGDASYIALRLDVSLNQATAVPYEPVYHEYVHYLMRHLRSQLPLWMVEGLAEFYGNTRIESKKVFVGAPNTRNVMLLRETRLLPVNTLFDVDASSPYYHEESKTSIFYAESWALTHYLIARDWKEKTHRVSDFVALLGKGVNQREAAGRTIGDAGSLEPAVRKDIQNFLLTAAQMDPPKIDESGFQTSGISDAESLAVRADFMAHDRHYPEPRRCSMRRSRPIQNLVSHARASASSTWHKGILPKPRSGSPKPRL